MTCWKQLYRSNCGGGGGAAGAATSCIGENLVLELVFELVFELELLTDLRRTLL